MDSAKTTLLEGYKTEHAHLETGLTSMTELLDRLQVGVYPGALGALGGTIQFLQRVLVPHAEWEELTFYPALGALVREHGDPNDAMLIDHREILARVNEFVGMIRRVEAGEQDPGLLDRVRILGYQIRALVDLHCRKEEEIYCALLKRHLSDREAVRALALGDQAGHD